MDRAFFTEWSIAPKSFRNIIYDRVYQSHKWKRTVLEEQLIDAKSHSQVHQIVQRHRGVPKRLARALTHVTTSILRKRYETSEAITNQLIIAKLLCKIREGRSNDTTNPVPSRTPMLSIDPGQKYCVSDVLLDENQHAKILAIIETYQPIESSDLQGVHFYSETPLENSTVEGKKVEFERVRQIGFHL